MGAQGVVLSHMLDLKSRCNMLLKMELPIKEHLNATQCTAAYLPLWRLHLFSFAQPSSFSASTEIPVDATRNLVFLQLLVHLPETPNNLKCSAQVSFMNYRTPSPYVIEIKKRRGVWRPNNEGPRVTMLLLKRQSALSERCYPRTGSVLPTRENKV